MFIQNSPALTKALNQLDSDVRVDIRSDNSFYLRNPQNKILAASGINGLFVTCPALLQRIQSLIKVQTY